MLPSAEAASWHLGAGPRGKLLGQRLAVCPILGIEERTLLQSLGLSPVAVPVWETLPALTYLPPSPGLQWVRLAPRWLAALPISPLSSQGISIPPSPASGLPCAERTSALPI